MANTVAFEITATDKNVATVLRGVNAALADAANGMKVGFKESASASDGLFGSMKELKSEAIQHQRVFGFFGKQLTEVSGIAKGLSTDLVGVGIALASGMWITAAVEGIKGAVEWWKELNKEAHEFEEVLKKLQAEKPYEGLKPDKAFEELQKATRKPRDERAKVSRELSDTEETLSTMKRSDDPDRYDILTRRAESLRAKLVQLGEVIQKLNDKYEEGKRATAGGDPEAERAKGMAEAGERANKLLTQDQSKENKDRKKGDEEHRQAMLRGAQELAQGEEKIRLELAAKVDAIQANEKLTASQKAQEIAQANQIANTKILQSRWDLQAQEAAIATEQEKDQQKSWEEQLAEAAQEGKVIAAFRQAAQKSEQQSAEVATRRLIEDNREMERSAASVARSMTGAFEGFFVATMEGSQNLADVILKSFERMLAQIMARLMASGVLSLLGSFIGGPFGASLGKAGGNLLGNLFSFDVGTPYVPRDMVAQIHQGERVVPAAQNNPAGLSALAGGGGVVHNHTWNIQVPDGPAFYRYLITNASHFNRFFGEQQGAGRI